MAAIDFPAGLPTPLRSGYELQHVSPLMRSELESGRVRQRRRYTSVPTIVSVSWILTRQQAQVFESWFRYEIEDGAGWFNCRLNTPVGLQDYECRFADMYSGPQLVARDHWQFSADIEIRERQTLPEGWGGAGAMFVQLADIFDKAMNQEWPTA